MVTANFSPLLVHALTNKSLDDIPATPSLSDLPGEYVQYVAENRSRVPSPFPKNMQMLACKNCRKRRRYDLGHITFNPLGNKKVQANDDDHIQSTGYFRCKNCNAAGEWEATEEYTMMTFTAIMILNSTGSNDLYSVGKNQLFDGSSHKYATDAEEHLLNKIGEDSDNAFLWNRLGNLYYQGGRADLAVAAFERSLSLDPKQTESLYSMGMILEDIKPDQAANYYHKTLATGFAYTEIPAASLRDILSAAIRSLLYMSNTSNNAIPINPPLHIYEELGIDTTVTEDDSLQVVEGEMNTEQIETVYPIAELFMGSLKDQLPRKKVTPMKKKAVRTPKKKTRKKR